MQKTTIALTLSAALGLFAPAAHAGGILTPAGSPDAPIEILDHSVAVRIQDGFARTEVTQAFFNPNPHDLEAVYAFPVPESASLSELVLFRGEETLRGEVIPKDEARRIYEEARDAGEDAGLAEQNSYYTYEFSIARVPSQSELSFRIVYYQPIELDTGIGRYVYPQEDGGTDEVALSFWDTDRRVRRNFSFHLQLDSSWPVEELRIPGFEAAADVVHLGDGRWEATIDSAGAYSLDRDLVVYYRLRDDLPGRMELVPYRADDNGPGTFMLLVTPGIDLGPLDSGADYVFVLDTSGSMQGKLCTVAEGVARALGELDAEDRFRIITFSTQARDLTRGWLAATEANVTAGIESLRSLSANAGTNLYEPLQMALSDLDADRATSVVLLTDAVANHGEVEPARFHELMKKNDVRVFGFLMGNGANWPLMRTICDASGGFYAGISNADDVAGQLLLAKSKVTHEALHDATVSFDGVRVHDVTRIRSKVYRGQQLVLFGRYSEPGPLEVRLEARLTGEDKVYSTTTVLPGIDPDHPELERLWALDRIEEIQTNVDRGALAEGEGQHAIRDLGVAYQLVTDETSMLLLDDTGFDARGIERANRDRVSREETAQARRAQSGGSRSYRIDSSQPAFPDRAATTRGSSGGGAVDPLSLGLILAGAGLWLTGRRRDERDDA